MCLETLQCPVLGCRDAAVVFKSNVHFVNDDETGREDQEDPPDTWPLDTPGTPVKVTGTGRKLNGRTGVVQGPAPAPDHLRLAVLLDGDTVPTHIPKADLRKAANTNIFPRGSSIADVRNHLQEHHRSLKDVHDDAALLADSIHCQCLECMPCMGKFQELCTEASDEDNRKSCRVCLAEEAFQRWHEPLLFWTPEGCPQTAQVMPTLTSTCRTAINCWGHGGQPDYVRAAAPAEGPRVVKPPE